MHFLGIIWNPDETIFSLGPLQIKYYNMLWVISFALGLYLMKKIFNNEKKTAEQLDSLFMYSLIATMLGARLGHVIFYDWAYYSNHLLEILLPIQETADGFKFTGFSGLASHGAAIGVIAGMYLYTRKYPEFKILWILDRIVIPFAIGAFCVRLGNFFNSEIVGKTTDENFIFATKFVRDSDDMHPSQVMGITKEKTLNAAYDALANKPEFTEYLAQIPYRHPAQLYEGVAYIFVFLILYFLYWKTDKKSKPGYLFGLFLVLLWTIRFFVEFVKERQNDLDQSMELLSIGQWLSIPFILIGLYFMFRPAKGVRT